MKERYHIENPGEAEAHIDTIYSEIFNAENNMNIYLDELIGRFANTQAIKVLENAAYMVEPFDQELGVDESSPGGVAFFKGGLLGLRLAKEIIGSRSIERITEPPITLGVVDPENGDDLERKHSLAVGLMDLGAKGYGRAKYYHNFLEELEDYICPDVRYQPYVRRGFGLIMNQAYSILDEAARDHYEAGIISLRAAVDEPHGIDWDTELKVLLGKHGN